MKTVIFTNGDKSWPIRFSTEENTIWMTQNEIAALFGTTRANITLHIRLLAAHLKENPSTGKSDLLVAQDGKRRKMSFYNLDIVRLIGFKINPSFTQEFYNWCSDTLTDMNKQNVPIQSNIIRFEDGNVVLDVRVAPNEDTVYLSQDQLATLFDTSIPNISIHIKNIFESGELDRGATIKDFLTVQIENGREVARNIILYNLDMIIALGYRVNSKQGILFRKWATKVLKQYSLYGYAFDEKRVAMLENSLYYVQEEIKLIKEQIDDINNAVNVKVNKEVLFYEGEVFDGYDFMCGLIRSAYKRVVFIDPYIDEVTLSILKNKRMDVDALIYTSNKCRLTNIDIDIFIKQYGNITLHKLKPFHDRFVLLDDSLYILGPSINRIGHYISSVVKTNNKEILRGVEKTYLTSS